MLGTPKYNKFQTYFDASGKNLNFPFFLSQEFSESKMSVQ